MPQRDPSHLTDILQAAKQIQLFLQGVDKEEFDGSALIQSAVIRQIEIIGEAAKRLSQSFRSAHPDIPWRRLRACAIFLSMLTTMWILMRFGTRPSLISRH
jgi:uncharacterized protein with HEPN domain